VPNPGKETTNQSVILSEDWSLRLKRKDQPQSKDPCTLYRAQPPQGVLKTQPVIPNPRKAPVRNPLSIGLPTALPRWPPPAYKQHELKQAHPQKATNQSVILSEDWSLRLKRKDQPQSKDPYQFHKVEERRFRRTLRVDASRGRAALQRRVKPPNQNWASAPEGLVLL